MFILNNLVILYMYTYLYMPTSLYTLPDISPLFLHLIPLHYSSIYHHFLIYQNDYSSYTTAPTNHTKNRDTPTVAYLCSITYILLQTLISFSTLSLQNHSYEYVLSIVLNIFLQ